MRTSCTDLLVTEAEQLMGVQTTRMFNVRQIFISKGGRLEYI